MQNIFSFFFIIHGSKISNLLSILSVITATVTKQDSNMSDLGILTLSFMWVASSYRQPGNDKSVNHNGCMKVEDEETGYSKLYIQSIRTANK